MLQRVYVLDFAYAYLLLKQHISFAILLAAFNLTIHTVRPVHFAAR